MTETKRLDVCLPSYTYRLQLMPRNGGKQKESWKEKKKSLCEVKMYSQLGADAPRQTLLRERVSACVSFLPLCMTQLVTSQHSIVSLSLPLSLFSFALSNKRTLHTVPRLRTNTHFLFVPITLLGWRETQEADLSCWHCKRSSSILFN